MGHYPPVLRNHILSVLQHVGECERLQSKPVVIWAETPLDFYFYYLTRYKTKETNKKSQHMSASVKLNKHEKNPNLCKLRPSLKKSLNLILMILLLFSFMCFAFYSSPWFTGNTEFLPALQKSSTCSASQQHLDTHARSRMHTQNIL